MAIPKAETMEARPPMQISEHVPPYLIIVGSLASGAAAFFSGNMEYFAIGTGVSIAAGTVAEAIYERQYNAAHKK